MTVYAEVEREYFVRVLKVDKKKIRYIPYGTDWDYWADKTKLKRKIIVAAGIDSGRDYQTLFSAVKNMEVKVEVACHPSNVEGLDIPSNVKVRILAPYSKVRNMFRRALMVVVPMIERGRSSGQMVVLEASSAKAPVIASGVRGIVGAFSLKEKQHLYYVKPENVISLRRKIGYLLDNPSEARMIGRVASAYVRRNYTSGHLAANIAKLIKEIMS